MPSLQRDVMLKLYGSDLWQDFVPTSPPGEVQGWNGAHPSLQRLSSTGQAVAVDVGVWKGQSTITLASAMKASGVDGCVIAVDTFLGSPEHWASRTLFGRHHGRPDIFETFMSNVYHAGVTDYVIPMPQTSVTAASPLQRYGIAASVVHIDAAHEYEEVLRDAEEYWKILAPGGYLVGDDYHETWPGVVRAAGEFSAKVMRPMSVEPPKWILQKT